MKQSVKSDPSREKRFRALIQGEFRPEFNREVAIAIRRALRQAREKQAAGQGMASGPTAPQPQVLVEGGDPAAGEQLRQSVHDALVRAQYKVWQAQEAEARQRYPSLSLARELKNPDFVRLLTDPKRPMTVCRAYEAVHLDDIQAEIAREAAVRTAVRMAALSRRPRESGAAPQAGLPMHYGASDPKSRAEIARRAMRGERITL